MLFSLFLVLPVLFLISFVICMFRDRCEEAGSVFAWLGTITLVLGLLFDGSEWSDQARDLGTIKAQDEVIAVYEQQVLSLTQELQGFHYTPGSLLNADSPVAAVVKSLTDVQGQLTDSKVRKAQAIVSIEQRRNGPFSQVIKFVGDYK